MNMRAIFLVRWSFWALGAASILLAMTAAGARHGEERPRGAILFENRCARCHGVNGDGDGGLAPSLIGVFGRPAASRKDFVYTDALMRKGGIWSRDMMDSYLANPQAFAPGSDMDVNASDPGERAAIIDFVETLK